MEHTKPVDSENICKAEQKLNVVFADDYKKYLSAFGTVESDIIAISGLGGYLDVVELTEECRSVNSQVPYYVIEDADGLVIWQDETGAIYQTTPCQPPKKIHNSLAGFLEYVNNQKKE